MNESADDFIEGLFEDPDSDCKPKVVERVSETQNSTPVKGKLLC